jgi:5-enolpyruvylshikimate-3-phosphate synthase
MRHLRRIKQSSLVHGASDLIEIVPLSQPSGRSDCAGSKSITNRALVLAALGEGEILEERSGAKTRKSWSNACEKLVSFAGRSDLEECEPPN